MHPRAYVCIVNEKTKGKFPGEHHVVNEWSELGKQIIHSSRDSVRKARESHLIDTVSYTHLTLPTNREV